MALQELGFCLDYRDGLSLLLIVQHRPCQQAHVLEHVCFQGLLIPSWLARPWKNKAQNATKKLCQITRKPSGDDGIKSLLKFLNRMLDVYKQESPVLCDIDGYRL